MTRQAACSQELRAFTIAPSDMTFLLHECLRCFYLKVKLGQRRPRMPMPKVFTTLDRQQKAFYKGKSTSVISPDLPPGVILGDSTSVSSMPIQIPGRGTTIKFRGAIDTALGFDDGTFGLVDFKTTNPRDEHVEFYEVQLHAYALAA